MSGFQFLHMGRPRYRSFHGWFPAHNGVQPVSRDMELWMKILFRHLATLAEQIMIWREGIYYSLWIETLGMNYKRIKTGYGIKRY